MIKDAKYETWKDLVAKAAKSVARDFPDVEAEDLYQDLWIWVYSKGGEYPHDYSYNALMKQAKMAAWEYRKQHLTLNPQYAYRTSDVRKLVGVYYNDNYINLSLVIDEQPLKADGTTGSVPLDYEAKIAVKLDIEYAIGRLSASDRQVVEKVYRDGIQLGASERQKLKRAIEKMTDYLNFYRGVYEL